MHLVAELDLCHLVHVSKIIHFVVRQYSRSYLFSDKGVDDYIFHNMTAFGSTWKTVLKNDLILSIGLLLSFHLQSFKKKKMKTNANNDHFWKKITIWQPWVPVSSWATSVKKTFSKHWILAPCTCLDQGIWIWKRYMDGRGIWIMKGI